MSTVISIENLNVCYRTASGTVRAANGVDFSIKRGECLGLVGESGSGKSTTALALMRLIRPPGYIESGRVLLGDRDLLSLTEEEMRQARFARIALIPQGAMNSLNPVMRVGTQIADTITAHANDIARSALDDRVASLLELVDLDPGVARSYPHELSGGMKQRVCLAIGVALEPEVIIADEPTSALDVVMQKQVMETLRQVQADLGAAMVLVGHDMGLMAQCADRIGVMYAGRLVEVGRVAEVLMEPLHPYAKLLVACLPSLETKGVFRDIPGLPPSLLDPPPGCPFHPRCPEALDRCSSSEPPLVALGRRRVSCLLHEATS